jgi:hypothetical protein
VPAGEPLGLLVASDDDVCQSVNIAKQNKTKRICLFEQQLHGRSITLSVAEI